MGGAAALEAAYRGNGRVSPLTIPAFMPNAPAAHVAMRQGVQGPVLTYSVACASSSAAIAEAAKAVQRGEVDIAIAGGSEALIVPGVVRGLAGHADAGHLPARRSSQRGAALRRRPQRLRAGRRRGLPGSGIGRARAPPRRPQLRHAGRLGPEQRRHPPHQARRAGPGPRPARRLRQAGLQPRDVGYCNAHGTATRIGDVVERNALADVWGDDFDALRVSSTKALHGHMLGAAGASRPHHRAGAAQPATAAQCELRARSIRPAR
jgi:3-oxoacyl-[acyl-carrier-protein] synthase II